MVQQQQTPARSGDTMSTGPVSDQGPDTSVANSSSSTSGLRNSGPAAGPGTTGADPTNRVDGAGNNTTDHQAPTVEDGADGPGSAAGAEEVAGNRRIRLNATEASPVQLVGSPAENQIYEEILSSDPAQVSRPDEYDITRQIGTVARPSLTQNISPDGLFIGGQPRPQDIRQGGFSDCYLMAALGNVAATDPARLTGGIHAAGGSVSVDFFRFDAAGNTWVPVTISVTESLVTDTSFNRIGAGYTVGSTPVEAKWYGDVTGSELWVDCDETYEAALWAAYMEKAYASYTEAYGQYGGYDSANANAGASGYDRIEGGIHQYMYLILYGNRATDGDTSINYTPGQDVVTANQAAIENLVRVNQNPAPGSGGSLFMMNSQISPDDAIGRLSSQVDYILAQPTSHNYRVLRRHLEMLKAEIAAWNGAAAADKDSKRRPILQRAGNLSHEGNWPLLHSSSAPEEYRVLNEFCNVVANLGDDTGGDQRLIYAWHSYSVLGASFVDKTGAGMTLGVTDVATQLANIDGNASSVRIRNPHHTNEPDPDGRGIADGKDDGEFQMPLAQYLRNFTDQQTGTIAP